MLMTEDEAGAKWCPMARSVMPGEGGGNRTPYGGAPVDPEYSAEMAASYPCLASGCMWWRWADEPNGEPAYRVVKMCDGDRKHVPLGYCGAAGKVEG